MKLLHCIAGASLAGPLLAACNAASYVAQPVLSVTPARVASGSSYGVIYKFPASKDGEHPQAPLVARGGLLYGTAYQGGRYIQACGYNRCGIVFDINLVGSESLLYNFKGGCTAGCDGANPASGLIGITRNAGTLYGTTRFGGLACISGISCALPQCGYGRDSGCGTVFAVTTSGSERVLYRFQGGSDGKWPFASLISRSGALYGTTYEGGTTDFGTVFEIGTSGVERVLYRFNGPPDGEAPLAPLLAVNGSLFGTTYTGGLGYGTVFEINASGHESILYAFKGGPDGASPVGGLVADGGAFYGTTLRGGANLNGTVFKVTASGVESVLYSFAGGSDGALPAAGLTTVAHALYGVTESGGGSTACAGGCGTIFKLTRSGRETVLYSFLGGTDGAIPVAPLVYYDGALFGTTSYGGDGYGTIFRIVPVVTSRS